MAAFFPPIELGREPTNLGIQVVHRLGMRGRERRDVVPAIKDRWESFQRLRAPVAQDMRMNPLFGNLGQRLFLFQQIQRDVCFEGGRVNLFHQQSYLALAHSSV